MHSIRLWYFLDVTFFFVYIKYRLNLNITMTDCILQVGCISNNYMNQSNDDN